MLAVKSNTLEISPCGRDDKMLENNDCGYIALTNITEIYYVSSLRSGLLCRDDNMLETKFEEKNLQTTLDKNQ
jgi:hypothetical protein